ncbi:MAG: N-acetylmuramoyl-L-alanine amidase [Alistipes sp.]|nr:N-acetylmuramoyl-L-alanine amidase [Alistipes sp.]
MRARKILLSLILLFALVINVAAQEKIAHGIRVIVLDAGHGGNDPGAVYGNLKEKDVTLKVVQRLGKKIEQGMPGVKVVYTRTSDKALAPTKIEDLQRRADIANAAEGDLFLSVHVNAARSTKARGVETLIMGETPKEQQYNEEALFSSNRDDLLDMSNEREAAIVRAYIQNLQFTYGEYSETLARCIQKRYVAAGRPSRGVKKQPLRVLYATNMPGVLTEIGFMSNKEDLAYLKSDKGLDRIVNELYQAVGDYSLHLLRLRSAQESAAPSEPKPEVKQEVKPEPKPEVKPESPKQEDPQLYNPRLYSPKKADQTPAPAPQPAAPKVEEKKPAAPKTESKKPASQPAAPKSYYTVQVMASKKSLSRTAQEFKSYRGRVHEYQGEGSYRYKYGVGQYATRAEASRAASAVRKTFPNAFVVAVSDGHTVTGNK